jgi:hypothetical protein
MAIGSAIERGSLICVYDERGSITVDSRSHSRVGKVMAPLLPTI